MTGGLHIDPNYISHSDHFRADQFFCVYLLQEHLMDFIVRQKSFWAEDDESVLRAIREGFIQTHQAMWKELGKFMTSQMTSLKCTTA